MCLLLIELVDPPCWVCPPHEILTHLSAANRFNPIGEVPVRKHPPEKNVKNVHVTVLLAERQDGGQDDRYGGFLEEFGKNEFLGKYVKKVKFGPDDGTR